MGKVLSNSERILFCEQMGMILKSGISAAEGIMIMKEDAGQEESPLRELYEEIQRNLDETGIFYDALEETGAFPDYMIQMARIGEQTGNLDEVMEGLAAYYEREENMVQDIKSAVTYPLLMLGMMLVIFLVMIVKVLPVFAQVYEQLGGQMTGMAAVLLQAGIGIRRSDSADCFPAGCRMSLAVLHAAGQGAVQEDGRRFLWNPEDSEPDADGAVCFGHVHGSSQRYGLYRRFSYGGFPAARG